MSIMNEKGKRPGYEWYPNTPESKAAFGLNTYGPDVETDYCLEFMERRHKEGKPFLVYHATHLGHGAFDWFYPDSGNKWPGTPIINWDGETYHRTEPNITGSNGVYNTHGTVSENGLHAHINYMDYMLWRYMEKAKELGVADNTIFIFAADNGSHLFGKGRVDQQRGTHVPLIIYAPGMTKQGEQDILASLTDFVPTLADIMGVQVPENYEYDGASLWPYLMTDRTTHHDWIYSYKKDRQMIRSQHLIRDGYGTWWDAAELPEDHASFEKITDWERMPQIYKQERKLLEDQLKQHDLYKTEYNAPK